jgi:hypothetical protein
MEESTLGWNFVDFSNLLYIPRPLFVQIKGSVVLASKSWGQRRTREVRKD